MARIAFAWELGGELGHAMACNALARTLHAHGHRIAFVFRELHQLSYLADTSPYEVFQAPVSVGEGHGQPVPSSFADILVGCGYDRPDHLAGLLGGWLALFERWKPDLVIADFSPTALLAARVLGLRRVSFGNGFSIPPRLIPLPAFRFDEPVSAERVKASDAHALATVNAVLARFGVPPLHALAQQFEADDEFLATFPELDAYGNRPKAGYWGPRFSVDQGASVRWPAGGGKRVLLYLKNNQPQLDALIDALARGPHRVAAFIPDLEPARRERLRGPSRIVSEQPMRLAPLLEECDLFVSQGGNVSLGTLMSGVPQLLLPSQYEQYISARRIEQLGAGLWLGVEAKPPEVDATLGRLLREPAFPIAAKAYARRYSTYSARESQRRIAVRIEEILAQPSHARALPHPGATPILSPTSNGPGGPR
jgi:UDP:flavonoid glycosyltransferase YjiC (YdhE family)